MADIFGITADSFANDTAECAGVINDSPDFPSWGGWESYSKMLPIEYKQCVDEGKDIEKYEALFDAVHKLPDTPAKDELADVIYKIVRDA